MTNRWIKTDGRTAAVTLFDENEERVVMLPCRFIICSHCEGSGQSSAYLGAYTASEWAEQDDDFKEDYMAGRYDRPCEHCVGTPGRCVQPDFSRMSRRDRALWRQQCRDDANDRAIEAMERRMGA